MSRNKPKERERYYLFPGQGGRNFRRKQWMMVRWAALVALLFGGIVAAAIWWFGRPMH